MISTIVVTLGKLAESLVDSAQHIIGKSDALHYFSVDWGLGFDEIKNRLSKTIANVDHGEGVLVLTDMLGTTATNVACNFQKRGEVEVLTGVNLPMVVKVLNLPSGTPLQTAVDMVREQSRNAIQNVNGL